MNVQIGHRKGIAALAFLVVVLIAGVMRLDALTTLPPGLKYDAASNGVYILGILRDGIRPFFVMPMGAPEPLILYLQAVTVWLFGANVFALRIVSALAGILTVAALCAAALAWTRDWRTALVAAFALAVALEPIHDARAGLRFMLVPLFETLLLLFVARGWRAGRLRDFILAGLVLGFSVYTYPSALMLPVVIGALGAHQFLVARATWRARWRLAFWMLPVACIVALPRIVFHLQYPNAALSRAHQVNLLTNPAVATNGLMNVILAQLLNYVTMFGIEWKGSTFGRPLLDFPIFLLFAIGVAVCVWRWKRIEWFWAPVTLAIMFLPDLLAANEPVVNKVRSIGIIPPTFFMVGAGAAFLLGKFRNLPYVLVIGALLWSAAQTWDAYFVQRIAASSASAEYDDFNTSRIEVAQAAWIARQTEPVYLPLNEYARSTTHYLVGARAPYLRAALRADGSLNALAAPARAWIVLPLEPMRPRTEGILYVNDPAAYVSVVGNTAFVLPPVSRDSLSVEERLQARAPSEVIRDAAGAAVANAYRVDETNNPLILARVPPPQEYAFSRGIALVTSALNDASIKPPGVIALSLFWRIAQRTADDYVIFVHLLDPNGEVLTTADITPALGAYPTYLWKPGGIIPTHHQIRVPARAAPGKYVVETGMYDALSQNRLDVLDDKGNPADSRVVVGWAKVAPRETIAYNPRYPQRANFDNRAALSGYDIQPGDSPREFRLAIFWQGLALMDRDYTFFAHVVDAEGKIVTQSDHQPQAGRYPTSIWDAGEPVRDDFKLELPADAPIGRYSVKIGWYDLQTGERLPVRDANDRRIGDSIELDTALEVNR